MLGKCRRHRLGLGLHALVAAHGARDSQDGNALPDVLGDDFCLLGGVNLHRTAAIVKAGGDGILLGYGRDLPVHSAVIRHGAGQFCASRIGSLALQDFRHCRCGIGGIHIQSAGTHDGCTGLVVGGDVLCQLVRADGVLGQVQLYLSSDNHFVYILICHFFTPLR